ncbi:hypothetical protein GA0115255_126972 [Streptomyces sp. Ncost-T6T-2b]|nr:hypothetical protein GA0115255_126972 [Streptomyces sp. Ncost-T6T-2b]
MLSASSPVITWCAWWWSGWRERTSSKSLPVSSLPSSGPGPGGAARARGWGLGGEAGGGQAGLPGAGGLVRPRLGPQGAHDPGAGEEDGRVGALGFDEQPVTGPVLGGRGLGESEYAVSAAVPVPPGGHQQRARLGPSALDELAAYGVEFAVVERRVEDVVRAAAPATGATQGRRGRGHAAGFLRCGVRADDRAQQSGRQHSTSRGTVRQQLGLLGQLAGSGRAVGGIGAACGWGGRGGGDA